MPNMAIYDMAGEKAADIDVPDELLGLPYNGDLVHQAVVATDYAIKRRGGKAKSRSEVAASHAKWYRQKGLGRARHGSRNAPVFVGGAKAHGPRGAQPTHKMPKKMRRKALFVALSERNREGALTVVDKIELESISTQAFAGVLEALGVEGRVLVLLTAEEATNEVVHKSGRNLADVLVRPVPHFSTREAVWADEIVISQAALEQLMKGGAESAE